MDKKLQLIVFLFLVLLSFDDSFGHLPINYSVKTNNLRFRDWGRAHSVIIGGVPNTAEELVVSEPIQPIAKLNYFLK